jgi:hypothetical protein
MAMERRLRRRKHANMFAVGVAGSAALVIIIVFLGMIGMLRLMTTGY